MKNETEKMYDKIAPLVDKMRAKYPTNIDGLEPALTSDIAEICVKIATEAKIEGLKEAVKIADNSKATFFIAKGKKVPEWSKETKEVLYELKAEICNNIERRIIKIRDKK